MNFKVRKGYIVHHTTRKDIEGQIVETSNSYPGGSSVDFDAETAKAHLHKLEATDDRSRKWISDFHSPEPVLPTATSVDHEAIATGVVAALVKAGLIAQPAKA